MSSPTTWASVHVHGSGDLGEVLTGAVAPVMRRLVDDGSVHRWFYLRYWEGGPHLRVRAATLPDRGESVTGALRDGLAGWHMPPSTLSATEYRQIAEHLARAEGRTDYERDLLPPGTVRAVPYRPEHEVYGDGATLAAAERHFVESSALALDVLATAPTQGVRRGLALSVNLMTLADHEPDLDRLGAAFRDAADGTNWSGRVSPDVMSRMNDSYERSRAQVGAEVDRAWRIAGGTEVPDEKEPLARWLASIRALRLALEAAGDGFTASPAGSPHAWYLTRLEPARRSVAGVLLRCTHLFENRIGVTTPDEIHIGYLVARALAERGGAAGPDA
jgi:Lantibiotic biosynthesis dehydratase C-term